MDDHGRAPTVLVVDDEPEVRKLVAAIISSLGYAVLTADNGEHALSVHEKYPGRIDLLVTDVIAPGMSGPQLAQLLAARQPDLKVLYISGYDRSHVVQAYVLDRGCHLLTKPFTASQLGNELESLLVRTRTA
jgi:two-component system cell cycle sensor histidine kinase/response regulator CckA